MQRFYSLPLAFLLICIAAWFSIASAQEVVDGVVNPGPDALLPDSEKVLGVSETGLYIVHLKDAPLARYVGGIPGLRATSPRVTGASRLDVRAPESIAYREYLDGVQRGFTRSVNDILNRSVQVRFQYVNVLNAVALELEHHEALELANLPEVLAVYPDTLRDPETDVGPKLIGAPTFWDGVHGLDGHQGEGVVVGLLDTGINPEHPSFAAQDGDGYDHVNPHGAGVYFGVCDAEQTSQTYDQICNAKLIGAWSFIAGPNSEDSARDWDNHGSHVAGTIAGNRHTANVRVGSETYDRLISGVAPRANIISYQVCDPRCPSSSSLAALNQAIQDGVQVVNYSISGGDSPWTEPVDLAFLDAYAAGIFVAASAGNDGPDLKTVAKTGPWNASVAASTHNRIIANTVDVTAPTSPVDLQGIAAVPGEEVVLAENVEGPVIWSGDVEEANVLGCDPFPDNSFADAVALIQRGTCVYADKIANAHAAGAMAVIVYNNTGGPPITMAGTKEAPIPAVFIDNKIGQRLVNFIAENPDAQLRINKATSLVLNDDWQNLVAGLSSRGPSQWDLLKPDFAAPGVNILAAAHDGAEGPGAYAFLQGTSMASPHVAGAAALLRQRHPDWTPAEIKSALALTAWQEMRDDDGESDADFYDMGSGRIDLSQAAKVGLVMDETVDNYRAADPNQGGRPKTLNQPGMVDRQCAGTCDWTRVVRNVLDEPVGYTAEVQSSGPGMAVTVKPDQFEMQPGATRSLEVAVEIDYRQFPDQPWVFGQVLLRPDNEDVAVHRLPVIVAAPKPFISVAPDAVSSRQPPNVKETRYLAIFNTGGANLEWEMTEGEDCDHLDDIAWLSVSPLAGDVTPGVKAYPAFVFNSSESEAGKENAILCIASNDHQTSPVQIEVILTVDEDLVKVADVPDPDEYGGSILGDVYLAPGQTALLRAVADTGHVFANWTEDGDVVSVDAVYTFTVTGERSLRANFVPTVDGKQLVSLSATPLEAGSVDRPQAAQANPEALDASDGGDFFGFFSPDAEVEIRAEAGAGWVFTHWIENGVAVPGADANYRFTPDNKNRYLVAKFEPSQAIPTLSEWGMIIFSAMLLLTGWAMLRKQRQGGS